MLIDWISYVILFIILVLVIFAILKPKKWLSILTIIILQLCIVWRESGINSVARNLVWEGSKTGIATEDYRKGVDAIADFCDRTNIYVYIALMIILIICIRNFKK
jgi:hypothetical protein